MPTHSVSTRQQVSSFRSEYIFGPY